MQEIKSKNFPETLDEYIACLDEEIKLVDSLISKCPNSAKHIAPTLKFLIKQHTKACKLKLKI